MIIFLGVAVEQWSSIMRREREEELIFRGEQIVDAIRFYQKRFRGGYPPSLKVLVDQKFLRKLYKDPMTEKGQWNLVLLGQGGGARNFVFLPDTEEKQMGQAMMIVGVVSQSKEKSARIYNEAITYDKWVFTVFDQRKGGAKGPGDLKREQRRRGVPSDEATPDQSLDQEESSPDGESSEQPDGESGEPQ